MFMDSLVITLDIKDLPAQCNGLTSEDSKCLWIYLCGSIMFMESFV